MTGILMSHTVGNANVRNAALALADAGLLREFWVSLAWRGGGAFGRLLPARLVRSLARRSFPEAVSRLTHTRPLVEVGRLLAAACGCSLLLRHETGRFSVDAVNRSIDGRVSRRVAELADLAAVYSYEDLAVRTFAAAKARRIPRFYDLPIGYWRSFQAIHRVEQELEPEWAPTLLGNQDSAGKLEQKDEELRLASAVIVASSFTKATLALAPGFTAPVHVVPYGAPPIASDEREWSTAGPLRLLYVGSLTQRKGISYLFKAAARFAGQCTLTVIGSRPAACPALDRELARHRYLPSLPHQEILAEMSRHDLLIFPSLFEGYGLVITEAMSQGLPVVTTAHTAGPDVISDGEDGFLVPIRSVDAIAERIEQLLCDRPRLAAMGRRARAKAASLSWADYRAGICAVVAGAEIAA